MNTETAPDLSSSPSCFTETRPWESGSAPEIMLLPSSACPASCAYCFGPHAGGLMSEAMIDTVLDWIAGLATSTAADPIRVTLHGGEPLCIGEKGLRRIFDGLSGRLGSPHRIQWSMQSNLWLVDGAVAELLAGHHVRVGTSLDGPGPINDAQRGKGYFARTVRGIHRLRELGVRVSCITTVTARSLPQWREIFDFILQSGMDTAIHPSVQALGAPHAFALSPDAYGDLLCRLLDAYLPHRHALRIPTLDRLCRAVAHGEPGECTFRPCLGMFLAVDPNGDIYSCQRFAGQARFSLGNVSQGLSLRDLFESPAARKFDAWQHRSKERCRECPQYSICHGGCPYHALSTGDAPAVVDPYCTAYKKVFSHIRNRLDREIASPGNIQAMAARPWNGRDNPLFGHGPLIDLVRDAHHPRDVARRCRHIIAAHGLARASSPENAALELASEGCYPDFPSALRAIDRLKRSMEARALCLNNLYLHVTWRCRLGCTHCYADKPGPAGTRDMDPDRFSLAVRTGAASGFRKIIITGGEPLEHPSAPAIFKQMSELPCRYPRVTRVLRTHLSLPLADADLDRIARAFDRVVVSLDGDEATHDARRGKGAYGLTVENLRRYQLRLSRDGKDPSHCTHGPPWHRAPARLSLACTQSPENLEGGPGEHVRALARRLGIGDVRLRPVLPVGRARSTGLCAEPVRGITLEDPVAVIRRGLDPVLSCGLGQNLAVDPNGNAYPCHAARTPGEYLGNAFEFGAGIAGLVQRIGYPSLESGAVDRQPYCSPCEFRYICGGMCKAWAPDDLLSMRLPSRCERLYSHARQMVEAAREYLARNEILNDLRGKHHVAP